MLTHIRTLAAFFAVLMLSACAQVPAYKAVDPGVKATVTASQVTTLIPENEIYADIRRAGGGAGLGLVGALIDSSIDNAHTKKAEKAIAPARNALLDFDFDKLMMSDLQGTVAKVDWLHVSGTTLSKDNSQDGRDKAVLGAEQPYTLLVYTDYHMTPDFHGVIVKVNAVLFPKGTKALNGQKLHATDPHNALASQTVVYRKVIPDETLDAVPLPELPPPAKGPDGRPLPSDQPDLDDDERQALILWTQNGGQLLKDTLTQAAADASRLLAQALVTPPVAPANALSAKVDEYGRGQVLEKDGLRDVVLMNDNTIVSSDAAEVDTSVSQRHSASQ